MEKKGFEAAFLKVCEFFLFRQSKKTSVYFGLNEFFNISREGRSNKMLFMRSKSSFLCIDI